MEMSKFCGLPIGVATEPTVIEKARSKKRGPRGSPVTLEIV